MKAEFWINDLSTTSIRRVYAEECRNYQFDNPCSLRIHSIGMDGLLVFKAVNRALENIAWVRGIFKETEIKNIKSNDLAGAKITIEEIKQ